MAADDDSAMDVDRPSPHLNGSPRRRTGVDFVTSGMFIIGLLSSVLMLNRTKGGIDEIHFPPPQPPVRDIPGGAGSFSAIGARIFSPPPFASRSVGWIVDCGSDFPPALRQHLAEWETYCLMRETPGRLTTRGLNGYGENEFRGWSCRWDTIWKH
jgi:hypothetical protein